MSVLDREQVEPVVVEDDFDSASEDNPVWEGDAEPAPEDDFEIESM